MKIISIIRKSLLEQIRSYWVLLLTVSMGPFFIMVYYLIIETWTPHYELSVVNNDKGAQLGDQQINEGDLLIQFLSDELPDTFEIPFSVKKEESVDVAIDKLKQGKTNALLVIPENFSKRLSLSGSSDTSLISQVLFYGDLTNTNYLITAVWANEMFNSYLDFATQKPSLIEVKEIAIGSSGNIDDFDLIVPGILIVSIIMLMFTASIAFVTEVESKTIIRLKLSEMTGFQYLTGVSVIQLIVGVISLLLTLLVAIALGFDYSAPILLIILISLLTSLSIIAFSLIIAAFTKTANEVLVVGNFPLFLFMFFTGAAFPLEGKTLFTLGEYSISIQGLMSPTHAISALNKILITNLELRDIIPELIALLILTIFYFAVGLFFFQRRHLRLQNS